VITPEQRALRRNKIGASDVPLLLGFKVPGEKTLADLWLEKTGRLDEQRTNQAMKRGTFLEPGIIAWACDELGKKAMTVDSQLHPNGALVSNLDAAVEGNPIIEAFEAKSCAVPGDEWGEERTDEIPERVLAQVHAQHACVPTMEVVWVPLLGPFLNLKLYRVERSPKFAEIVAEVAFRFIAMFVKTDTRPDDYKPSIDFLKLVRRVPKKIISIPSMNKFNAWQAAEKIASDGNKIAKALKAEVLASLEDAEGAELPDGSMLTYQVQKRSGYEVKPTEYRVLRHKAAKGICHDTDSESNRPQIAGPVNGARALTGAT
jgi:hypothetical protein